MKGKNWTANNDLILLSLLIMPLAKRYSELSWMWQSPSCQLFSKCLPVSRIYAWCSSSWNVDFDFVAFDMSSILIRCLVFVCLPGKRSPLEGRRKRWKKFAMLAKEWIVFFHFPVLQFLSTLMVTTLNSKCTSWLLKFLLKPVSLENRKCFNTPTRPILWHVDDGRTIDKTGYCAVMELHYCTDWIRLVMDPCT